MIPNWEYRIIHLRTISDQILNDYGAVGWELVSLAPDPSDPSVTVCILKRQVPAAILG